MDPTQMMGAPPMGAPPMGGAPAGPMGGGMLPLPIMLALAGQSAAQGANVMGGVIGQIMQQKSMFDMLAEQLAGGPNPMGAAAQTMPAGDGMAADPGMEQDPAMGGGAF